MMNEERFGSPKEKLLELCKSNYRWTDKEKSCTLSNAREYDRAVNILDMNYNSIMSGMYNVNTHVYEFLKAEIFIIIKQHINKLHIIHWLDRIHKLLQQEASLKLSQSDTSNSSSNVKLKNRHSAELEADKEKKKAKVKNEKLKIKSSITKKTVVVTAASPILIPGFKKKTGKPFNFDSVNEKDTI